MPKHGASDSLFAQLRSGATHRDCLDKRAFWWSTCRPLNDPYRQRAAGVTDGPRSTRSWRARAVLWRSLQAVTEPILRALGDPPSLKVCDGTKDLKPAPRGRGGVDPLLEADPIDAATLKGHDGIDAFVPGPSRTIGTHHHPTVARPGRAEECAAGTGIGGASRQRSFAGQTDRPPFCPPPSQ